MANEIGKMISNISDYIEIKFERLKLRVITKVAKVMSAAISLSLITVLFLFLILFLSMAVAFLINDAMDSNYLGFFIVAGFYLVIIVIILILVKSRKIQGWFEKLIINIAEKEDEQDN